MSYDADDNGVYNCPVENCLHVGFRSQRGLRKHINTKHQWLYYFHKEPKFDRSLAKEPVAQKLKASTHKKPMFSINAGCGAEFKEWLQTPCGGGKKGREAEQTAKRGVK